MRIALPYPRYVPALRCCLSALAALLSTALASAQPTNQVPTTKTTLCELARNPELFNGKMIQVRASAMGRNIKNLWIDDFEQKPACSAWMGVVVVLPEQITPKPEFDAVRDAIFQQFSQDINGMNVQATFEGRFDAAYTWKESKREWVAQSKNRKGFGKGGQYGGRIVLSRVSDVVARYVPRR